MIESASGGTQSARRWGPAGAPRWVGNGAYLVGFLNVLTGVARGWRDRLHALSQLLPGALTDTAAAVSVVSGVLLVLLAHSLKRRKHRAWLAASVLATLSLVAHLVKGHPAAGLTAALLLLALVVYRKDFFVLPARAARALAPALLVGLFATSLLIGTAFIEVRRSHIVGGPYRFIDLLSTVVHGLAGISGPITLEDQRGNDVLFWLLLGLGLVTALVPAWVMLRSPTPVPHLTDADDARIRAILNEYPDSLGYFSTRRDKSLIFSPTGKACITYRVTAGVMLAGGDPLGDPEAWPLAIHAFLDEAERHGWAPAVLGCSETGGRIWQRESGLSVLELGDEAIVDSEHFTMAGRPMRNVRQMVNRVRRQGYETQVMRVRDSSVEQRQQAMSDAAKWRGSDTERGFSMASGRVMYAALDPDNVIVTATKEGAVRGFLQFVPWGSDGMSLDMMRRDRASEPGVNDLLIVDALAACATLGVRHVSLNFAFFRGGIEGGEKLGAGPVAKFWRALLVFFSRWFQIESLYRFNDKFQPRWVPRYALYPGVGALMRVALAMAVAEAFLPWKTPRWLREW